MKIHFHAHGGGPISHESFFRKEGSTKETIIFTKAFCEAKKF
jgi:hypothetical protein